MDFTIEELRTLNDLVYRVTSQVDFEYQDEDYQKKMSDLEQKIEIAIATLIQQKLP